MCTFNFKQRGKKLTMTNKKKHLKSFLIKLRLGKVCPIRPVAVDSSLPFYHTNHTHVQGSIFQRPTWCVILEIFKCCTFSTSFLF